jgi:hypothetical protein
MTLHHGNIEYAYESILVSVTAENRSAYGLLSGLLGGSLSGIISARGQRGISVGQGRNGILTVVLKAEITQDH